MIDYLSKWHELNNLATIFEGFFDLKFARLDFFPTTCMNSKDSIITFKSESLLQT